MQPHRHLSTRIRIALAAALLLLFATSTASSHTRPRETARVDAKAATLAATIFSFDGRDFVRAKTNLVTEAGKSAVNTKLDHDTPAYKALVQKHSFAGEVTVFGKRYDGQYAPIMDNSGSMTGALFVGEPK